MSGVGGGGGGQVGERTDVDQGKKRSETGGEGGHLETSGALQQLGAATRSQDSNVWQGHSVLFTV